MTEHKHAKERLKDTAGGEIIFDVTSFAFKCERDPADCFEYANEHELPIGKFNQVNYVAYHMIQELMQSDTVKPVPQLGWHSDNDVVGLRQISKDVDRLLKDETLGQARRLMLYTKRAIVEAAMRDARCYNQSTLRWCTTGRPRCLALTYSNEHGIILFPSPAHRYSM